MRRSVLLSQAFCVVSCLAAFAQEKPEPPAAAEAAEPTRLEVPKESLKTAESDWYGVYMAGNKSGFASIAFRSVGDKKAPAFEMEMSMEMKLESFGQKLDVSMRDSSRFDGQPPYRLQSASYLQTTGGFKKQIDIRRDGEGYQATIQEAGKKRTRRIKDLDFTLADVLTPELWAAAPRKVGDKLTSRHFETSTLELSTETYEIQEVKAVVADGVETVVYTVEYADSATGVSGTAHLDGRGQMLSLVVAGIFDLRLEPEELAKDIDYSADLFVFGMARIDQPLGEAAKVTRLVVEVEGKGAAKLESGPGQTVTREADAETSVVEVGPGEPVQATPEEIEDALEDTVEHPISDEAVLALAKEAIGDADTTEAKVERLVTFVDEYIEDDFTGNPLTTLDIIQTKRGDCTEHALLLTTLARAVGIPAREVTGLVYMGDEVQAFGGHAWTEVVLDGHWQPVDAAWRETRINATHIRFGAGRQQAGKMLGIIGGVTFKLRELERADKEE